MEDVDVGRTCTRSPASQLRWLRRPTVISTDPALACLGLSTNASLMAAVISSQDVEDLQEVRAVVAEASDRWPASASSSDLGRAGDEGVTAGPSSTAPPSSSIASTHAQSSTISTFEKGKAREEAPLECSIPESAEQGMRPSPATKVVRTVDDLEHKVCPVPCSGGS